MTIHIEYETEEELKLPYEEIITAVVNEALDYENCPYEAEVNVLLTDDEDIRQINKEYREIDRATDVLSFPMADYDSPSDFDRLEDMASDYFNPETGELLLGDIVISVDKVKEQAEKYGHSETRELPPRSAPYGTPAYSNASGQSPHSHRSPAVRQIR